MRKGLGSSESQSGAVVFCLLWLFLPYHAYATSLDQETNNEQQYTDRATVERLLSWGGGVRDSIRIGDSSSGGRRRSSRSYVPKYGRRYGSDSQGGFTASGHYEPPPARQHPPTNYFEDYNDYSSGSASYRTEPCAKSKGKKKSKSDHKQQHKYVKAKSYWNSKSKTKGRSGGGSYANSAKSTSKGRSYYENECEDDEDVEEITCSANIEDFGSSVTVIFNGDPQFLTAPEQVALERSFEDTYNQLTFANCDGLFRQIESVRGLSLLTNVLLIFNHFLIAFSPSFLLHR